MLCSSYHIVSKFGMLVSGSIKVLLKMSNENKNPNSLVKSALI